MAVFVTGQIIFECRQRHGEGASPELKQSWVSFAVPQSDVAGAEILVRSDARIADSSSKSRNRTSLRKASF
jgi:hypothetical protein